MYTGTLLTQNSPGVPLQSPGILTCKNLSDRQLSDRQNFNYRTFTLSFSDFGTIFSTFSPRICLMRWWKK